MKIIKPEVHVEGQDWKALIRKIEHKGRVCYKSEDRINDSSADNFIKSLIQRGHLSVLEHEKVSVKFTVDRGVSHEIVRHRIAAYSQESTRYCNYGNSDNGLTVIEPFFFPRPSLKFTGWRECCEAIEQTYLGLLATGASPQEARSVLPNSLKTEIWVTYNLREWIHFFTLRAAKTAHPQMRQVVIPLLHTFEEFFPFLIGQIPWDRSFPLEHYAEVKVIEEGQV